MTKNKGNQYVALLTENNGKFKVKLAKRLQGVNQFVRHWQRINARSLARKLNNGELIIK